LLANTLASLLYISLTLILHSLNQFKQASFILSSQLSLHKLWESFNHEQCYISRKILSRNCPEINVSQ